MIGCLGVFALDLDTGWINFSSSLKKLKIDLDLVAQVENSVLDI